MKLLNKIFACVTAVTSLLSVVTSAGWANERPEAIEVLSWSWGVINSGTPGPERIVTSFASPAVPPDQAVAAGLDSTVLALRLYDQDGYLLTAGPPLFTVPRGAFRTVSIGANCLSAFDACDLTVVTPDGIEHVFPGAVTPLHDRVIVRRRVACVEGYCGPGMTRQDVVTGPGGSTHAIDVGELIWSPDLMPGRGEF